MTNKSNLNFDILLTLMGYHLRRAQISFFNDFENSMGGVQITLGQFGVITLIAVNPGLTQSALARAVGIERSTMVAVIHVLESRSLVERRPSPVDGRSYALVRSAEGSDMLKQLKPMVLEHEKRVTANLDPEERSQLLRVLSKLTHERH